MEFQSCYLFHRDFGAKRFDSAEEVEAAGDGWFDNPVTADEYPVLKAQKEAEAEYERLEFERLEKETRPVGHLDVLKDDGGFISGIEIDPSVTSVPLPESLLAIVPADQVAAVTEEFQKPLDQLEEIL